MSRKTTRTDDQVRPLIADDASRGRADARLLRGWVVWALLGVGAALRLRQYLANRSLWMDESLLAPSLLHRSFGALLQPLENEQVAPLGFLFAERLAVILFGTSEYALRLFPLLTGLGSLVLFWKLAERMLPPLGSGVALALFAVSENLVYYASEAKQYSSDVAIAVGILLMAASMPRGGRVVPWALAAGGGALAIWFSHPVAFVLTGIGIRWLWVGWRRKEWRILAASAATGAVWAASFALSYLVSLAGVAGNEALRRYWQSAAAPIPPKSFEDLWWYWGAVDLIASIPLDRRVSEMVALLAILGGATLFAKHRDHAWWLIGPGALALLASGVHKYPLLPRLWLFMVPALLLLVAAGMDEIWTRTRKPVPLLGPVLVALLFIPPVLAAGYHVVKSQEVEEIKPLLQHVRQRHQEGDVVYLYHAAQYPARYYAERGLRLPGEVVVGTVARENQAEYARDIDKLRGKGRVWFLFSHVYLRRPGLDPEKLIVHYADRAGHRLSAQRTRGASLYLYDLR